MRILIDARVIQDHFPGIGRYVFNLIKALVPQLEGDLLVLVAADAVNSRYDLGQLARYPNITLISTDIPIFHWRSQTVLPGLIRRLGPDLVHFPYNVRPLWLHIPSVLTLYDVIPRRFPLYFSRFVRWKIEAIQRAAIRASDGYMAISQATADDFIELYGVSPGRIAVTPLAPDPVFHPRSPEVLTAFRQRLNLPESYVLYLGSNKPHKNLSRLIRAWAKIPKFEIQNPKLIVAGHWDDRYSAARELGFSDSVRFLGPVSGEDLPLLYAGATAFIFPSLYEGFGLPVLEAMASGVAVVCSRAQGLTEVAGEAALTFDPRSMDEMTAVITRLLVEPSLREELQRRGLARAATFSWEQTARLTLAQYQQTLTRQEA